MILKSILPFLVFSSFPIIINSAGIGRRFGKFMNIPQRGSAKFFKAHTKPLRPFKPFNVAESFAINSLLSHYQALKDEQDCQVSRARLDGYLDGINFDRMNKEEAYHALGAEPIVALFNDISKAVKKRNDHMHKTRKTLSNPHASSNRKSIEMKVSSLISNDSGQSKASIARSYPPPEPPLMMNQKTRESVDGYRFPVDGDDGDRSK